MGGGLGDLAFLALALLLGRPGLGEEQVLGAVAAPSVPLG